MSDRLKPGEIGGLIVSVAGLTGLAVLAFGCYLNDTAGREAYAEEHPGKKPIINTKDGISTIDCRRRDCVLSIDYQPEKPRRFANPLSPFLSRAGSLFSQNGLNKAR